MWKLLTITERTNHSAKPTRSSRMGVEKWIKLDVPIHPSEILRTEFLELLDLKPYTLAKKLHVPRTRIERLANETTPVTPDTALRLAKFFGTTPQFWMNMQASYDLAVEGASLQEKLKEIERFETAA
ncbi:HigA family addiction module antitoxin [Mesorhizobium sp. CA4]|uniref:HigA family addiction module antitoxin n=1 Tax=Mesorhizobium sp. CA4 TaxID=588499 RepID=UPI0029622B55|nr:HigA family addiction module antitoxin [Mesorhizobium sp. CA4]